MSDPAEAGLVTRELRFGPSDMELFAAVSGDWSPLHTDREFGRRTAFGQCIVYGGLETIALLGLLPEPVQRRVRRVRSSFPGPVLPGVPYAASARPRPGRPDEWEIQLTGRGKLLARVAVSAEEDHESTPLGDPPSAPQRGPARLEPGEEFAGAYAVGVGLADLAARVGAAAVTPAILEAICWASHAVGMSIPGFNGLCAAVSVSAGRSGAGEGAFQRLTIRENDPRTDRLVIAGTLADVTGAARCGGVIECFPFAPTPLPDVAALDLELAPAGDPGPIIVVGGSRGLGGAVALTLLARGHAVHVLYSASDAAARELGHLARGRAHALTLHRVDAADPLALSVVAGAVGPGLAGLVLSAAPPPLPMALAPDAASELSAYVADTVRLAATPLGTFGPLLRREVGWIVFCSAAAVAQPIRELPQLSAAKAAIEGLAQATAVALPTAPIVVARLPRMRTDLVNTPGLRSRATPPETIAAELIEHLTAELEAGVTVLTPTGATVPAS